MANQRSAIAPLFNNDKEEEYSFRKAYEELRDRNPLDDVDFFCGGLPIAAAVAPPRGTCNDFISPGILFCILIAAIFWFWILDVFP